MIFVFKEGAVIFCLGPSLLRLLLVSVISHYLGVTVILHLNQLFLSWCVFKRWQWRRIMMLLVICDDTTSWLRKSKDVLIPIILLILHYFVDVLQVQRLTHGVVSVFRGSISLFLLLTRSTNPLTNGLHLNLLWLVIIVVLIRVFITVSNVL